MAWTCNDSLQSVHKLVLDHVQKLVTTFLILWTRPSRNTSEVRATLEFCLSTLTFLTSYILHLHMKRCQEKAEERINWLLELEKSPFTLNTHYFSDYRAKFLAHYRGARERCKNTELNEFIKNYKENPTSSTSYTGPIRAPVPQLTGIAKALSILAEIGIAGVKAEDLPKLLPPDPMEPVLAIMADVRAYFQGW